MWEDTKNGFLAMAETAGEPPVLPNYCDSFMRYYHM